MYNALLGVSRDASRDVTRTHERAHIYVHMYTYTYEYYSSYTKMIRTYTATHIRTYTATHIRKSGQTPSNADHAEARAQQLQEELAQVTILSYRKFFE